MVQVVEMEEEEEEVEKGSSNGSSFCVNDNMDLLIEILKRLDERSLCVAACVCRLWCALTRNDALWEHLCFRQLSPPPEGVRTVVVALGGYRRLYTVCVKPVLTRLGGTKRKVWSQHEVELSLSLFCVDYYEKLFLLSAGDAAAPPPPSSSLMFLCKPVN